MTIEEREEYEPHLRNGTVVYAGVDYGAILDQAQEECDVLLWDGGNNDFPFYRPTVHITVADPLRAGHETTYHPGETNFRMAGRHRGQQDRLGAPGAAGRHRPVDRGGQPGRHGDQGPEPGHVRGAEPT